MSGRLKGLYWKFQFLHIFIGEIVWFLSGFGRFRDVQSQAGTGGSLIGPVSVI